MQLSRGEGVATLHVYTCPSGEHRIATVYELDKPPCNRCWRPRHKRPVMRKLGIVIQQPGEDLLWARMRGFAQKFETIH